MQSWEKRHGRSEREMGLLPFPSIVEKVESCTRARTMHWFSPETGRRLLNTKKRAWYLLLHFFAVSGSHDNIAPCSVTAELSILGHNPWHLVKEKDRSNPWPLMWHGCCHCLMPMTTNTNAQSCNSCQSSNALTSLDPTDWEPGICIGSFVSRLDSN